MKYTQKIIGLILVLVLSTNSSIPISYAELTEPEKECAEKKQLLEEAYLIKSWEEADPQNQDAYETAFEEMQVAYHDYIGCIFNFAEEEILQGEDEMDWVNPEESCLTTKELKNVVKKTEPSQMLGPILETYADYRNNLLILGNKFDGEGVITDERGKLLTQMETLQAKSVNIGTIKRQRQMEIDSSLLAIDLMFTSLKELRLAFVMHIQFQCTLKFLDEYRRALEDLRNVIEPLPGQLEDASIS